MNKLIITNNINNGKIRDFLNGYYFSGENYNLKISITRLRLLVEQAQASDSERLGYTKKNIVFKWIDSEEEGTTVECENKTHQADLTDTLADAKKRVLDSLDWTVWEREYPKDNEERIDDLQNLLKAALERIETLEERIDDLEDQA